jgi:hypothetical protein
MYRRRQRISSLIQLILKVSSNCVVFDGYIDSHTFNSLAFLAEFHSGVKRTAYPPPAIPAKRHRPRAVARTQTTATQQKEQAQLAGSSLPPTYYTDTHYDRQTSRTRASRAIDCWLFVVGTQRLSIPSSEEVGALCVSDEDRMNRNMVDLRRPQEPRLRCTECL